MEFVIIIIILALVFDYINGFHDAANSIATIVSTKVLTPFQAVVWAAFFNFIAFLIFKDHAVANTIGKTVNENFITLPVIFSGLIAAIIWNLLTWWYGIPSSSSHTLIGGFAGAAVTHAFMQKGIIPLHLIIDSASVLKIIMFIFLAPIIGMFISTFYTLIMMQRTTWLKCTVIVERAGDVIPYIVGSIPEKRSGNELKIKFPTHCPSCEHQLVKPMDESVWRCINTNCPAQLEEHLIHFVSKQAMDIFGFGEENVRTFLRHGIIHNIHSIYEIDYDKVRQLEGWKDKSIQNLKDGIEASKQNELHRLIVGLSIRHVGNTTAKMLAKKVNKLTDFQLWNEAQFLELEDVGPKVAQSLFQYFSDKESIALIENLEELGVNIAQKEIQLNSNTLNGKTFLCTGTFPRYSRDDIKLMIEKNGGKNLSAVSSNLNYLIAGEKAGGKLAKAQKIPSINIIDEETFLKMIE